MKTSKTPFTSNTLGGILTMLLMYFLPRLGVTLGEDEAAVFGQNVDTLVMAAGGIWAFVGRVLAKKSIRFGPDESHRLLCPPWIAIAALLVVTLIASGCETLRARVDSNDAATRLVVSYATLKYVEEEGTSEDRIARAQRVHQVAVAARQYLDSDVAVTVAALQDYVVSRIDWTELDAADRVLAQGLLDLLAAELHARAPAGIAGQDPVVVARWIVDVVIATLEPYVN